MSTAYDYSARAINPSALKNAGVGLVMRYVSTPNNPKNITKSEYAALTAASIQVGLVYETTAGWMLGGYNAGFAAAKSARAQATVVGYPTWQRIWYAADLDLSKQQIPIVLETLRGCAAADGSKNLVAVYGEYDMVEAAYSAGYPAPWQTEAWSQGRRSTNAPLFQTTDQTTCDGVQVDINEMTGTVLITPVTPDGDLVEQDLTQEEDDMSTTSQNGRAGLGWAKGAKHVVQVTYDPGVAPAGTTWRVVAVQDTGPVVLVEKLVPQFKGKGVVQITGKEQVSGVYVYCSSPIPFELYAA